MYNSIVYTFMMVYTYMNYVHIHSIGPSWLHFAPTLLRVLIHTSPFLALAGPPDGVGCAVCSYRSQLLVGALFAYLAGHRVLNKIKDIVFPSTCLGFRLESDLDI